MRIERTLLLALALTSVACGAGSVTAGEAAEAVSQATYDSQANALTSNTIELSTNFTLGKGLADAADELRGFIGAQLPCAEATRADNKLTVVYGAHGTCLYRGHTISGTHTITITQVDESTAQVDHTWTDLSNGKVKVSGTATVTWNKTDQTRHVVHNLSFTRLATGATATGSGDRTQRPLSGSIAEGIQVDGTRQWVGPKGEWNLTIDSVQMRWADSIPYSGSYELETPKGVTITLTFERIDDSTIRASVVTPRRTYTFKVRASDDEPEADGTTET